MISHFPIFADCGAPSLYNKLSKKGESNGIMGSKMSERKYDNFAYTETPEYAKYRQDYIDFLLAHPGEIQHYSNLDVINNPILTHKNQKIMEEAGLKPIPVFHLGSPTKWLDRYVREYDYIAIGGLVPNPTTVLIPWLDKLFKDHILDENGFPKTKVHGFACTSLPLMLRYPWYSVDSATCRKLAMYGGVFIAEYSSEKLSALQISNRDIPLKNRLTAGVLRTLERQISKYGMTAEDLAGSIILRMIWNYLLHAEKIEALLPNWPWRLITDASGRVIEREPAEGAKEFLTFYVAGSLSKKEELIFWEFIENHKVTHKLKGRLQSYFYKTNLEYAMEIQTPK